MEQVCTPDIVEKHLPDRCSCGHSLSDIEAEVIETRQVFDLPDPKLEVTEHQKLGCCCPSCGKYNEGSFPSGVNSRVQYGHGVQSLVVLLNTHFKVPYAKVCLLFKDLYGYCINKSTIFNATERCTNNLSSSEQVIKEKILESEVVHFDETGIRVAGSLHWLHVCCTALFTYFFVHIKRGYDALSDVDSLLNNFKGRAIHDCMAAYFKFKEISHGLCGAHLLREFNALIEQEVSWAVEFRDFYLDIYKQSDNGNGKLDPEQQKKALIRFQELWDKADEIEPMPQKSASGRGRPKSTKGRNLLKRLKEHQAEVLAFAFYENVPFTNNQAERDLRPVKTKQKVAGSFRELENAKRYARIQGFISTARKQEKNVFRQLRNAFAGHTFLTQ